MPFRDAIRGLAVDQALRGRRDDDGRLPGPGVVGSNDCRALLNENLVRRQATSRIDEERVPSRRATVSRRR